MKRIPFHTSLIRAGLGLALASVFTVAPAAANPVTVDINSVSGVWSSVAPPGATSLSGVGTNQIFWGTPADSQQSSYKFAGAAPPVVSNIPLETTFNIGTFTHFNFPITGTAITSAVLGVTTNLTVHDGFTQTLNILSNFTFHHNETTNSPPCPPGSVSVCDDIVTFAINQGQSQSFNVEGTDYFVDITGFLNGSGNPVSSFLTQENHTNVATMQGIVTSTPGEFVPPESVPAPLSLLLVGTGLIGLMLARRRR